VIAADSRTTVQKDNLPGRCLLGAVVKDRTEFGLE